MKVRMLVGQKGFYPIVCLDGMMQRSQKLPYIIVNFLEPCCSYVGLARLLLIYYAAAAARRAVQPRLETRPIVLNWRVSGHFSRHYVCIGHDNACSKLCHIYRAEASTPPVAQRFQITKIRQKVHSIFV